MAIKVIKHGKKIFKAICPVCGCEFTYTAEDLKEDCFKNHFINCPDCDSVVSHEYEVKKKGLLSDPSIINYVEDHLDKQWTITPGLSLENNLYNSYDCDKCPYKPDFKDGNIKVGDTPCTWCRKNVPYCSLNTTPNYDTEFTTATSVDGEYTIK